jgi:hypothetical protein
MEEESIHLGIEVTNVDTNNLPSGSADVVVDELHDLSTSDTGDNKYCPEDNTNARETSDYPRNVDMQTFVIICSAAGILFLLSIFYIFATQHGRIPIPGHSLITIVHNQTDADHSGDAKLFEDLHNRTYSGSSVDAKRREPRSMCSFLSGNIRMFFIDF